MVHGSGLVYVLDSPIMRGTGKALLSRERSTVIARPLSLLLAESLGDDAMRYLLLAFVVLCATMSGCEHLWDDNGGHSVNLWPTTQELRAGEH
jgi:hypothetical protein